MARYIIGSGDTLSAIASRLGTGLAALVAANPQMSNPNIVHRGQIVVIPGKTAGAGAGYVVQAGDTVSAIASRFGVGTAALVAVNPQLTDPNLIFAGQIVSIPGPNGRFGSRYVVQSGDTLNAIASRFGLGTAALAAANPQISNPNVIHRGQILVIPGKAAVPGPEYVVQSGDTLGAIAARFGVRAAELNEANPQIGNPNRIFPGQIIAFVFTRVRRNIWTLHDTAPWHPVIHAYARGVAIMRDRAAADQFDPTGWIYQAAIHGTTVNPDNFRNRCQHQSWFFLSWHRMYLRWFERIIRAALQEAADVDDVTKLTWALPYWDYSSDDIARRRLPQAFLDPTLRDGVTPNPLRVNGRTLNNGAALPASAVATAAALAPVPFAGIGGFAGGRTGFSHSGEDPGSAMGPLEGTPHGAVHVQVGGLMGAFNTAALDPIFWLHHANIDRLWEVWRTLPGRADTTEPAWLTGVTFHFHDENATPLTEQSRHVLETPAQLRYRYEDISTPEALEAAVAPASEPEHPPELIGATDTALALVGDTATVGLGISAPEGPLAEAALPVTHAYLQLEHVTSDAPAGVTYGVYLDAPDGDPATDDAHYVGVASFFGIEETRNPDTPHAGMRLGFDITDLYHRLVAEGRWTDRITVTFVAQRVDPPDEAFDLPDDEEPATQDPGNVRVGRVSVFLQ
ncbi:LysM peptidoglycan-binding domain-containing protein [Nocardia sp. 2]|uniref:LysM peptidoglycan-binding domain-containing protein n=1 Tax=Nocardia acididurans TaxID=2802282 RepID=A0ABS1MHS4_9NOCA|nr:LysM peptidoglycan-binding domain-containing protein [Nocardia acididurans]MBL1079821.1 LysM peptidoglycan-binding domain-containing protein [Nocardia acididurans]